MNAEPIGPGTDSSVSPTSEPRGTRWWLPKWKGAGHAAVGRTVYRPLRTKWGVGWACAGPRRAATAPPGAFPLAKRGSAARMGTWTPHALLKLRAMTYGTAMSLLYRAQWRDESAGAAYVETAAEIFGRWAQHDQGVACLDDGEYVFDKPGEIGAMRLVTVRRYMDDRYVGIEMRARDEPPGSTSPRAVWTTVLRVVVADGGVDVLVENAMDSDDPTATIKVGRPRLVDQLLELPGQHRVGGQTITAEPIDVFAERSGYFVDLLRAADRTLPVIVFSEPTEGTDSRWRQRAEQVARRARGIAVVATLDRAAASALRGQIGSLGVWDGAIRTYMPAPLNSEADGWRHRYITRDVVVASAGRVVDRLVSQVAQLSTRRRPSENFDRLDPAPAGAELAVLRDLADQHAFETELAAEDRATVERELGHALGHLDRIRVALATVGHEELYWRLKDAAAPDVIPDDVQDTTEAFVMAQAHLSAWLVVPDSAERSLDGIDSAPNAGAWGRTAWRGFRALATYARRRSEGFNGNFWVWCEAGEPFAWPATPKKLSMTESETVQSNAKYRDARRFIVDADVDGSGEIVMYAHLKVSEGGGDLAPRIYFHDDVDGKTGKVHVGFVGPHYLVPNTKS